ncbi:MAG: 4'-phosphopantetheinyl transferase superfamily protein [Spirochaetia bacterium]|nr:4'-phosphopantetheinyl transferase superfamily protein [Spirochaetia bacterium]
MIHLGNDIIDFSDDDSNLKTYHTKFIKRVLSNEEIKNHFYKCINKNEINIKKKDEKIFWLIWSLKEAAYKVMKQKNKVIFFSPREFIVNKNLNKVTYKKNILYCHTIINKNYIYSLCSNYELKESYENKIIINSIIKIKQNEKASFEIRKKMMQNLNIHYKNMDNLIKIQFDKNIPFYEFEGKKFSLSITHHGRYAAAAACVDKT